MPKLAVQGFDGVQPRTSPTMLAQSQATLAENVKLYAGELRYWRGPVLEHTPLNTPLSIYKMYRSGSYEWLTFTADTDVVPGPLADTTETRLYYTSGGFTKPRKTNWALATTGSEPYPVNYLNMGVPAPTVAPNVTPVTSGAASIAGTYVYVFTYVSTFGSIQEESGPSPPTGPVTLVAGQATAISSFVAAGTTAQGYNITSLRIYRSISDSTGNVNYAFLDELPVTPVNGQLVPSGTSTNGVSYTGSTYNDTRTATQLGEALPSLTWEPPPDNMRGLVAMANGILAGFVGNSVYFCEPYYPHAWPSAYSLTVPDNIIGLGAFGSTLVVCTEKYPYVISGMVPGGMSQERLPIPEPCVAKRSIVSDEFGVTYASPNGLVSIGPGQRGVSTYKLFRRDEWQMVYPNTLVAAVYDNKYLGAFTSPNQTPNTQVMVLQRDDVPALSYLKDENELQVTAMHVDQLNGYLYYVNSVDNKIYRFDGDELFPTTYNWQSKRFVFPHGETFSCIKVDADYNATANSDAYNAEVARIAAYNTALFSQNQYVLKAVTNTQPLNMFTLNGSTMLNYPLPQEQRAIQVVVYGDNGAVVAGLTFTSFDPVRLPPFRAREMQILLSGNANVRGVALASTVYELRT